MKFKQTTLPLAAVALAIAALGSCGGASGGLAVTRGIVIQNAIVVNTRDGSLQSGVHVIIDEGRIQAITLEPVNVSGSAQLVDGTGKYVVPGYLDMHTHAASTLASRPNDFPVLLANGITGVREAGGSPQLLQAVREQNAAVAAGNVNAPEVLMMPSTIFAGQVATDAGARDFVRARLAEGADYFKIAGAAPPAFLAAVDEARKQGSHAAGHLPLPVSAAAASDAGYRSFEHLGAGMGLMLDCSSEAASIRAQALATPIAPPASVVNPRIYDGNPYAPFYQRIIDTYDAAKCEDLAKTFVRNDSWQAVTLIRLRTSNWGADPLYVNDPNLKYVDKTRVARWNAAAAEYNSKVSASSQATLQAYYQQQLRVVKLMQQAGVKILAGSDLGGGWVIPGFSLHQEFRELAAAGLSPLQVLQATTLNGARFVGRETTIGTVETGRNADLVLLNGNPIADVANLHQIDAVFLRGKYYPRVALDKLLADVATGYAAQAAQSLAIRFDPDHPPHN